MGTLTRKQRGASLVEHLAALLLFGIGALGWVSVMNVVAGKTGDSEINAQAGMIGQAVVDELRALPYDNTDIPDAETLVSMHGKSLNYSLGGERSDDDSFFKVRVHVTTQTDLKPQRSDVSVLVSWAESDMTDGSNPNVLSYTELVFSKAKP